MVPAAGPQHDRSLRGTTAMIQVVLVMLCLAVLLATPPLPLGPKTAAFVLALVALVMVFLRWHA